LRDGFFVAVIIGMALEKNTRHPNFIIGIVSFALFLLGIVLKGNGYTTGNFILILSIALGAMHWIWSIVDVSTGHNLKSDSKIFWLILVALIPPLGGMFYYMMKRKNVSM
jgi:Phospholipase_D-nuclease N-terminal